MRTMSLSKDCSLLNSDIKYLIHVFKYSSMIYYLYLHKGKSTQLHYFITVQFDAQTHMLSCLRTLLSANGIQMNALGLLKKGQPDFTDKLLMK